MDFSLTPEQIEFQEKVREYSEKEIAPKQKELDEKNDFDKGFMKKMGDFGWLNFNIPEKFGGTIKESLFGSILFEEVSKASASTGANLDVHYLLSEALAVYATDELKEKYLPRLATGELIGAFGITEPHAGSDAAAIKALAVRDGDDYILNGEKSIVAGACLADAYITFFNVAPEKGYKGITAFCVEESG